MKWDLGGRHFVLGVLKAVKLSQGRLVELGMSLAEKTQLITLEAAVKPHKDHRLNATCAILPLPLAALLLSGLEHARMPCTCRRTCHVCTAPQDSGPWH